MIAIFHDMPHRCFKDYVDDIIDVDDPWKVFVRCRKYNLGMNPLKWAFGVSLGSFLRFTIHRKSINLDQAKAKAILYVKPPITIKQLQSFLKRVSYSRRFIPALVELLEPFQNLLEKKSHSIGARSNKRHSKELTSCSDLLILWSYQWKGFPLTLYLTLTNKS